MWARSYLWPQVYRAIGNEGSTLGKRALLVTDSGLTAAGHPKRVMELLERGGVEVTLFDQSIENPTDSSVQSCAEVAKQAEIEFIVGLGGGSSMDTAKGCNFILTNGEAWPTTGVLVKRSIPCCHWLPFPRLPEREVSANPLPSFLTIKPTEKWPVEIKSTSMPYFS